MTKTAIAAWIFLAIFMAALPAAAAPSAPQAPAGDDALARSIDGVMSVIYKPSEPGAAILVQKGGRTIFRKGYGMADIELGVPVEPDMVFRLGSITKQFTAVSILMLAEQGKLGLQDEITKFLPDYPTQGRKITIEHLLTHTSGIQSYTDMSEWLPLWRKDFTLPELIDLFKNKPMKFEPGERWSYNNSGYVLLGAIIEKVSGQTYEQFVDTHIFKPLGLKGSCYDSTERIIPRRVPGYELGQKGIVNASYLSMTQPYAAGSLASTVDDLAVWSQAVFAGRLVKKEWLDKAFTPFRLKNGESSGYGFGWFITNYQGHRIVEHGGGINGFSTYEMTLPEDGIFIAILTNSAIAGRDPEPRAFKIATLCLGLPEPERKTAPVAAADLAALPGVYQSEAGDDVLVLAENGKLFFQRPGGAKREMLSDAAGGFIFADRPTRILVLRNERGEVSGLRGIERLGPPQVLKRTTKPLPSPRKEAAVDPKIYPLYAGDYELAPNFIITVLVKDGRLISRATGQPEVELFPESETKFFLKVVDAQVEFVKDAGGRVTSLVLTQGGQVMPAKKIRRP
jgi:CubicO group peptidase (beta-lactamase class C family)